MGDQKFAKYSSSGHERSLKSPTNKNKQKPDALAFGIKLQSGLLICKIWRQLNSLEIRKQGKPKSQSYWQERSYITKYLSFEKYKSLALQEKSTNSNSNPITAQGGWRASWEMIWWNYCAKNDTVKCFDPAASFTTDWGHSNILLTVGAWEITTDNSRHHMY